MSQEARGLDAGPRLAEKLVGYGDNRSAAIVSRIALEEKAHVAVGQPLLFLQLARLCLLRHSHSSRLLADLGLQCQSRIMCAGNPA